MSKYDFDELDIWRMQDGGDDGHGFKKKSVVNLMMKISKMKKAAAEELFE